MKKILLCTTMLAVLFSTSCSKDNQNLNEENITTETSDLEQENPLTVSEINQIINEQIKSKGDFNWNEVSDFVLWSALMHGENILTIGYGSSDGDYQNRNSSEQKSSKDKIISVIRGIENENSLNRGESLLVHDDEILTIIDVKVSNKNTIQELRKDASIRYMEPAGYSYFQGDNKQRKSNEANSSSGSGCGKESESLSASDYTTITPNAKMPWNFPIHNIDGAWSHSTGSGITIGIVDTGASTSQYLLNSGINNGSSSGKSIQRHGVYVDSFWPWSTKTDGVNDKCGHGTSMTAIAGAPRNDKGLPVGVAYNSNLVVYRAASNVVLDGYHEQKGVAKALTQLGDNNNVKIISMSMGHIFTVNRIKDAIRYANNKGKLIFCAAGTSTSFTNFVGVIFPASMSETVAVTGIEQNSIYKECDTCHEGSEVDFTIMMERSNNNHVPVLSYYSDQTDYVGGSSVATAMTAGIAALVWSKNPSWSKTQVLDKLKTSAHLYPNKHSSFGWGMLDALEAVQ